MTSSWPLEAEWMLILQEQINVYLGSSTVRLAFIWMLQNLFSIQTRFHLTIFDHIWFVWRLECHAMKVKTVGVCCMVGMILVYMTRRCFLYFCLRSVYTFCVIIFMVCYTSILIQSFVFLRPVIITYLDCKDWCKVHFCSM